MKYEETLKKFRELKDIDIEDVVIADEVYNVLDWLNADEFENVCKYIKKISRKKQEYSISVFVGTIEMILYTQRIEINEIIKIKTKEFFKHLETYLD